MMSWKPSPLIHLTTSATSLSISQIKCVTKLPPAMLSYFLLHTKSRVNDSLQNVSPPNSVCLSIGKER